MPITWISLGTSQFGCFRMSIIIEATASRIRPTPRSASAHSLLRSMCCSRVTVDNIKDTSRSAFLLAIGRPLAVAQATNFNEFRLWGM